MATMDSNERLLKATRIREIYFTVKKFNQSIYAYNITSNINNS